LPDLVIGTLEEVAAARRIDVVFVETDLQDGPAIAR
jgi:hypothetical protein